MNSTVTVDAFLWDNAPALVIPNDFGCRTSEDEFVMVCPGRNRKIDSKESVNQRRKFV